MNIKEASRRTGISAQNIRFYEKKGLLSPERSSDNGYRTYESDDIERLKYIKIMRMLDVSIEDIQKVFDGKCSFRETVSRQKTILEEQKRKLKAAIEMCDVLSKEDLSVRREQKRTQNEACTDIRYLHTADKILEMMEQKESRGQGGFFRQWADDYKMIVRQELEAVFSFIPDEAVTTPREFTDALLAYARQNDKDITITKESMTPEFILEGEEYTAMRWYQYRARIPMTVIRCQKTKGSSDNEIQESDRQEELWRKITRIFVRFLPSVISIVIIWILFIRSAGGIANVDADNVILPAILSAGIVASNIFLLFQGYSHFPVII